MVVAGMLAGALLLLGPALLKLRLGVDEVVTTLLLNFIVPAGRVDDAGWADEGPAGDGLAAVRGAGAGTGTVAARRALARA